MRHLIIVASVLFASSLALAESEPVTKKSKKAAKAPKALSFGGAAGAGFDSNAYQRADKDTASGSTDVLVKLGHSLKGKSLSWSSGAKAGGAFRFGDKTAAKVSAGAKTGLAVKLFGGGKKKKGASGPAGKLSLGLSYGFAVNPVIQTLDEGLMMPEEDDFVLDPEVEELLADDAGGDEDGFGDEDFGEDFEDDFADEEEDADAEEEGEEADEPFAEDDLIGGTTFGLENPKHNLGANLGFSTTLWKGGKVGLGGRISRAIVGGKEGKPSGDSTSFGGKLSLAQTIGPITVSVGYGLDIRGFDEKNAGVMDANGEPILLKFTSHAPGGSVKAKLGKALGLTLAYKYGLRAADANPTLDTFQHQLRLNAQYKLGKSFAIVAQTGAGFSGRVDDTNKDSSRIQALAGLQFKM